MKYVILMALGAALSGQSVMAQNGYRQEVELCPVGETPNWICKPGAICAVPPSPDDANVQEWKCRPKTDFITRHECEMAGLHWEGARCGPNLGTPHDTRITPSGNQRIGEATPDAATKTQLNRIEATLKAICARQAAVGGAPDCPK